MRNRGFSLVEVLVASGIAGVISLTMMEVMTRAISGQKSVIQKQSATTLQMNILSLLGDRGICELNFKNVSTLPAAPDTVTNIRTSSAPVIVAIQEAGVYEDNSVHVANIRLQNFQAYGAAGNDAFRGTMDLVLNLNPATQTFASTAMTRTVKLLVELNGFPPVVAGPATNIKTCVAVGGDLNNIWTQKANGDIYYAGFNVGIGTLTPTQMLEVNGNILATAYLHSSDARLKKNISPAPGLDAIEQLKGVHFNWRSSGRPAYGVIAQNVEDVLPDAVFSDPKTSMKSVSYSQLIGPLIESIKELSAQNQKLTKQLQDLEAHLHATED